MRQTTLERFHSHIVISESGCWEWQALTWFGYGILWNGEKQIKAYRFAYEFFNNTIIPEGLEIDHLCRNHKCVNPAHLEAVTHRDNLLRGDTFAAKKARVTHCSQGHPYDLFNTYFRPNGTRACKICLRRRQAVWLTKKPSKLAAH